MLKDIMNFLHSPVGFLSLLLEMFFRNIAAGDHCIKLSLRGGLRLLGDIRDGRHSLVINPELGEHAGQVPCLHVQLTGLVGEGEHSQLAVLELFPCLDDVRDEKRETSVVVEPPHVNGSRPLLLLELLDLVSGLGVQHLAVGPPVHGG